MASTTTNETTKVSVVPSMASNYATAVRAHLSAALAYMRTGDEILMEAELDSIDGALALFKEQAWLNVK